MNEYRDPFAIRMNDVALGPVVVRRPGPVVRRVAV